jgi:hypothetical protein
MDEALLDGAPGVQRGAPDVEPGAVELHGAAPQSVDDDAITPDVVELSEDVGLGETALGGQGEVDRRRLGIVADRDVVLLPGRGDEVADRADSKKVARVRAQEQARHDPAVGAGDQQRRRPLIAGELPEAAWISGRLRGTKSVTPRISFCTVVSVSSQHVPAGDSPSLRSVITCDCGKYPARAMTV